MSQFVLNLLRSVVILPYFVPAKIAAVCNNNASHLANNFQRWFIEVGIFQGLPVKICSLDYTLVDFPRKTFVYSLSKAVG